MRKRLRYAAVFLAMAIAGCAGNVPREISTELPGGPDVAAVAADGRPFVGRQVRWGGTIVAVENKPQETWVELLAKDLGAFGRPQDTDVTQGRFLVRVEGFLDPEVYSVDREVTVYGAVESSIARMIGERPYNYPLIKAERIYLWPEYARYGDDPWCDEFYWRSAWWHYHSSPWYWHRPFYPYHRDPFWDPFWGAPPFCRP